MGKKDQESQIEKIGCFGFDYIREDGKTKAKTTHHSILFFSTDFDQALSRAREEELRERAPQSIKGFNKQLRGGGRTLISMGYQILNLAVYQFATRIYQMIEKFVVYASLLKRSKGIAKWTLPIPKINETTVK